MRNPGAYRPSGSIGDLTRAPSMCKAAGKLWGHYNENETSQAFLMELEADIGIPISELVQSVKGPALIAGLGSTSFAGIAGHAPPSGIDWPRMPATEHAAPA